MTRPRFRGVVRVVALALAIPLLLISLVVASKLASLQSIAGVAISRYDAGAFEMSARSAEELFQFNEFEPWIAYFDRGTARAANGLFNESIDDLERAFDLAPDDRRCDVALNLSLAWESLGDQYLEQGQFAGAEKLYELGRAALDAAGETCGGPPAPDAPVDPTAPNDPSEPDPRSRLEGKSDRARQLDEQAKAQQEAQTSDPLEQLQEQNGDAGAEKERQQRQRDEVPSSPRPGDKPW